MLHRPIHQYNFILSDVSCGFLHRGKAKLTLYGKINIIKTLGLSKLIFSTSVLPIPENFAQKVNKLTFKFLWDAKPAKIKKSTITGLKEKGGLKMIDFDHTNKALKCAWINRLPIQSKILFPCSGNMILK